MKQDAQAIIGVIDDTVSKLPRNGLPGAGVGTPYDV